LNPINGTLPYTYQWSNNGNNAVISNLSPGNYSVTISDKFNCEQAFTYTITEPTAIQLSGSKTDETLYQATDGTATVNATGGISPYTYSWSNGASTSSVNNLASGNYTVDVVDANGCTATENFTILAGVDCSLFSANVTITNESSTNAVDGSIMVNPSGGATPYTYNWSNGASSQNLTNVGEGIYSVTITAANGCTELLDQLLVSNDCLTSIVQQNNPVLPSQVFQVGQFIQSNGTVNTNQQVSFKAGDYVELTNDFEVIQGADFEAMIDGCGP